MPGYRLYDLDGAGKFSAAEWIEADDDESVSDAARALGKSCRCEIWQGPRLVAVIEPRHAAPLMP